MLKTEVFLFLLLVITFNPAYAGEIMAPELHSDPFVNPLIVNQKKTEQLLDTTQENTEEGARSAFLWKPELRGIIRSSDIAIVNIDGNMISMGENFEGYRLIKVKERSVVFEKNGKHYPLSLDKPEEAGNVSENAL